MQQNTKYTQATMAEARKLLKRIIKPELIQTICDLIAAGADCYVYTSGYDHHVNLWLNGQRIEAHDITAEALTAAASTNLYHPLITTPPWPL